MGRALAEFLSAAIDARTTDDLDREGVLVEAAATASTDRADVEALLDQSRTDMPAEPEVRAIVEAAGGDADEALRLARADGDLFDGDAIADTKVVTSGGRLLEAKGKGSRPGTTRYKVAVIRPGRAQGPGRRFYSQRMLEAQASNFGGQPMFWNHEDLDVILKRGHGSRDPRDLCGWLQEGTSWDPDYSEPTDAAEGKLKGAVMGYADVNDSADELLRTFPEAMAVSINMDSTRIRVGKADDGKLAPLVEGVVKGSGSLDLITGKAGAGGKVLVEAAAVTEALHADDESQRLRDLAQARYGSAHDDLADLPDERLVEAARARPEVLAALGGTHTPTRKDPPVNIDELVAAFADETNGPRLVEAVVGSPVFDRVVEARVSQREDQIRQDATEESHRLLDLRDMRDEAFRLIEAAHRRNGGILTDAYVEDLKSRYTLRDGRTPSPALDVFPEVGEDGTTVVKGARERLVEAVTVDVQREEAKLRESAGTRLGHLGGAAPAADAAQGGEGGEPAPQPEDPMAKRLGLKSDRVRQIQGVTQ